MILEGIVTTVGDDDQPHVSAMGAIVTPSMDRLTLRPFPSSATFQNLKRNGRGVFHITDDVELIARAALGRWSVPAETCIRSGSVDPMLADCCRWYAFRVQEIDERGERALLQCQVIDRGWQRDFVGFNRAKHAILELTIHATRIHLLPPEDLLTELERTRVIVQKTAGPAETRAFDTVAEYISEQLT